MLILGTHPFDFEQVNDGRISHIHVHTYHTAGSDTIFNQIYMDGLPGIPRVCVNKSDFFTNETDYFVR